MRSLGIDTSNYTCSAALYDDGSEEVWQTKIPLPVKEGAVGLRQAQAVFEHVRKMGQALEELFEKVAPSFDCIGVSSKPRRIQNSYMPCFLVGVMAARSLAAATQKPLSFFSHQEGHIASALLGAKRQSWLEQKESFIAFHISGGTTDSLLITPGEDGLFSIRPIGCSSDLKAGQAIDRIGVSMGLPFPAGNPLEKLALEVTEEDCRKELKNLPKSALVRDGNCFLSGLENLCKRLLDQGVSKPIIARYVFLYLQNTIEKMIAFAFDQFGRKPVLFSGGVMSNRFLREYFSQKDTGVFAPPVYASDNAAGIALLSSLKEKNCHAEI